MATITELRRRLDAIKTATPRRKQSVYLRVGNDISDQKWQLMQEHEPDAFFIQIKGASSGHVI
jgi:hypothetical protein